MLQTHLGHEHKPTGNTTKGMKHAKINTASVRLSMIEFCGQGVLERKSDLTPYISSKASGGSSWMRATLDEFFLAYPQYSIMEYDMKRCCIIEKYSDDNRLDYKNLYTGESCLKSSHSSVIH